MPSTNSSPDRRIVIAVDGGIHNTSKGMTGGVGMIVSRLRAAAPKSKRVVVESISVRGRYFDASRKVTNNIMELMGFSIMASDIVDELNAEGRFEMDQPAGSINVEFWSDSQYALGTLFRSNWKAKKNVMLVQNIKSELDDLATVATVSGRFIRGHRGHFINEFADLVAALAIERKKDIKHELAFRDIEDSCLFCDLFPCQPAPDGISGCHLIKKWGDRFTAMRENIYGPPCANRKEYDAEFTLTRETAAGEVAARGSRGRS